jgi:hypothetical protein
MGWMRGLALQGYVLAQHQEKGVYRDDLLLLMVGGTLMRDVGKATA